MMKQLEDCQIGEIIWVITKDHYGLHYIHKCVISKKISRRGDVEFVDIKSKIRYKEFNFTKCFQSEEEAKHWINGTYEVERNMIIGKREFNFVDPEVKIGDPVWIVRFISDTPQIYKVWMVDPERN